MVEERFVRTSPASFRLSFFGLNLSQNLILMLSGRNGLNWGFLWRDGEGGDPEWVNRNLLFSSQENKGGLQRIRIF